VFSILTYVGWPDRHLFFKIIPPTHSSYVEGEWKFGLLGTRIPSTRKQVLYYDDSQRLHANSASSSYFCCRGVSILGFRSEVVSTIDSDSVFAIPLRRTSRCSDTALHANVAMSTFGTRSKPEVEANGNHNYFTGFDGTMSAAETEADLENMEPLTYVDAYQHQGDGEFPEEDTVGPTLPTHSCTTFSSFDSYGSSSTTQQSAPTSSHGRLKYPVTADCSFAWCQACTHTDDSLSLSVAVQPSASEVNVTSTPRFYYVCQVGSCSYRTIRRPNLELHMVKVHGAGLSPLYAPSV